ncbi:MAG: pilus assembly protein TadG-related protein, partial [Bdellovibrionales bacterium]
MLRKFVQRWFWGDDGSVLPFVAITFPVILGFVGLGTDASLWMAEKRDLQLAADAAVLAAGWELAQDSEDTMAFAAAKEADHNGYNSAVSGDPVVQIISSENGTTVLGVQLTQDAQIFFSQIVFKDSVQVSAYAEAEISDLSGNFCMLALEDEDAGAFTTAGNATINAPTCGIAVNSTDDEALSLSGNVDIIINNVRISGDYDTNGNVDFEYQSMQTGQSALDDPYADLEVPEFEGCDENNLRVNSGATLSPGVYCGGIDISGDDDVTFEPGVYILDGGDFKVTGSGELYGEGVTFILTGDGHDYAQLDISGSREVTFSAPESGEEWSGVTFFQDRNA